MNSKAEKPAELHIPPAVWSDPDARELLRAWAADGELHVSFRSHWEEPSHWGIFLADVARHAARAFANEGKYSEITALDLIREALGKELERPTSECNTEELRRQ
jgi:Domain of unknown function (DUF5076)